MFIVPLFQVGCLAKDLNSIIEIPLRHEGFRQSDIHIDLYQFSSGYFGCKFLDFMQSK